MADRIAAVGGTLVVEASPGAGTRVRAVVSALAPAHAAADSRR